MQNKKQEILYFDEFTSEKPWNAFTKETYRDIVKLFIRLINPKKSDIIIDMGSGTGELTYEIFRNGYRHIQGFDISGSCIAMAKKRYRQIRFAVIDIENTGLKSNSVDILFYCGILHHFKDAANAVKEAYRILKKKGKIFVFEPNASNPVLWLFRGQSSPVSSKRLKTPNEKFLTEAQIRSVFAKGHFKIKELGCVSKVSYTKEHFKKLMPFPFYYSVYFYNVFDCLLHYSPFRKRFGSFIYGCIEKGGIEKL